MDNRKVCSFPEGKRRLFKLSNKRSTKKLKILMPKLDLPNKKFKLKELKKLPLLLLKEHPKIKFLLKREN